MTVVSMRQSSSGRDAHGCTSDLDAHIAASQAHLPGASLGRDGAPRHCQGMALVDWTARGADGTPVAKGTNVLQLAPDGRFARIVGFWAAD